MTTFKTKMMLAAAAAASVLAAGAPAFAQGYGGYGDDRARSYPASYGHDRDVGRGLFERVDRLQGWLENARAEGRLRPEQAWRLSGDLREVRRQAWQARRDGIDPREADWINARLDRIADRLRDAREYDRRW